MKIIAVDPGTEKTAFVMLDDDRSLIEHGIARNHDMLGWFEAAYTHGIRHLAMEMIASMGMAVGQTVFETAVWIGRFVEHWLAIDPACTYEFIYRADEKMHLCGTPRAKDPNIRQAVMDKYGRDPIGNKRMPGPLYGVSKDEWAALAVAFTALEVPVEQRVNKRTTI